LGVSIGAKQGGGLGGQSHPLWNWREALPTGIGTQFLRQQLFYSICGIASIIAKHLIQTSLKILDPSLVTYLQTLLPGMWHLVRCRRYYEIFFT